MDHSSCPTRRSNLIWISQIELLQSQPSREHTLNNGKRLTLHCQKSCLLCLLMPNNWISLQCDSSWRTSIRVKYRFPLLLHQVVLALTLCKTGSGRWGSLQANILICIHRWTTIERCCHVSKFNGRRRAENSQQPFLVLVAMDGVWEFAYAARNQSLSSWLRQ